MRHFINTGDITPAEWDGLYKLFCEIRSRPEEFSQTCRGRIMASLFYEPSTRTSFSFQAAMMRLGGSVFGFSDPNSTSFSKGENLADTIRMCAAYADVIVMRSPKEGAALAASLYSAVPVINAGDGGHLHPTQTLADLATIFLKRGGADGLRVGICGDLKYGRTVHSLITALSRYSNIRFFFISPRELALPGYMHKFLSDNNQRYIEVTGLEAVLPQLDVLYMTRIQKERFTDPLKYERNRGVYILNRRKLERAKKDLLIMHPLPRVDEISMDVDDDPRAVYFEQAQCGMYIRMALLLRLSHMERLKSEPAVSPGVRQCENPNCITQTEPYLPPLWTQSGGEACCLYCDKEFPLKSGQPY